MRFMGLEIGRSKPAEARSGYVPQSSPEFLEVLGLNSFLSAADIPVTIETAMGIPAIFGAVNFISGTLAGLPLNLFERDKSGKQTKVKEHPLLTILHDAPNPEMTSFTWRKHKFEQTLSGGRGLTFIERTKGTKEVMNLWPLDPNKTTIKMVDGKRSYEYRAAGGKNFTYKADEIIDIPFMLKADGFCHRSPIMTNKDVVALAIGATNFGSKFFQNGGVPPFAVKGKFQSGSSMGRAADDLEAAVLKASKDKRQALVLPDGLDIVPLGADAQKSQLIELKRFLIEEFARIYSLPPTFLQDLSNGTFSNTEQQDLHFVKHTLRRWAEAFEQELNLKLFGRENRKYFVKLNLDGLLRGDFKTRMEGFQAAIQTGQMTPNEARALEDRDPIEGGDKLFMQGAMMPIENLGQTANGTGGNGNGA